MIKEAIAKVAAGDSLGLEEAATVMEEIMDGRATPSQLAAFIVALAIKGETAEEIAGLARTMRARAVPVKTETPVTDIVGTGGDRAGTFNISTASAFVAAGAGLTIAKHGNRAASSRCGSADVLEALGVRIDCTAEQVSRSLAEVGIGYMFAPAFHPAMKHAGPTRREIGIPTVFNILGPLTNPAGAQAILLGVSREGLVDKMAGVLQKLSCCHAMVIHGEDGLDEITVTGRSTICELKNGKTTRYTISPVNFGLKTAEPKVLKGGDAAENAAIIKNILSGEKGPKRDIVLLNAAAALVVGDAAPTLADGFALAKESLESGNALNKLEQLVSFGRSLE